MDNLQSELVGIKSNNIKGEDFQGKQIGQKCSEKKKKKKKEKSTLKRNNSSPWEELGVQKSKQEVIEVVKNGG